MPNIDLHTIQLDIDNSTRYWDKRNKKFKEWYEFLCLVDKLASRGMESYVSNEPATFFQMAHYLLTKGDITHYIPIMADSAVDLDNRAKIDRSCKYMWQIIDRDRRSGGNLSFIDELSFFLLILGWYSVIFAFDSETGMLRAQIWNPYDTYPHYINDSLYSCTHTYKITSEEAEAKAISNNWRYERQGINTGDVTLQDYFVKRGDVWFNTVLIDGKDVTGFVPHPEMQLLVAPVAGYPDRGSLTPSSLDWRNLTGKGIFEINEAVITTFNKWKSMLSQILRDTAQPLTQEFSSSPQATPEQLRERGGHFHFSPGESGIVRIPPAAIPIELTSSITETYREIQKGSFNDAVFGMMEGQSGYSLSLLASSSANQILYPYMSAKHFVLSEGDGFWLKNLKTSKRTFDVKGKFLEKLKPTDIPEDVIVNVESDIATPKDWLERGTIGGMVRNDLDEATLLSDIYHVADPQAVIRRKTTDKMRNHPVFQNIEYASAAMKHADYLDKVGDRDQANLFRAGARALEAQINGTSGIPEGQGNPAAYNQIMNERQAGYAQPANRVPSNIYPPEAAAGGGMLTPQALRQAIGKGSIKVK